VVPLRHLQFHLHEARGRSQGVVGELGQGVDDLVFDIFGGLFEAGTRSHPHFFEEGLGDVGGSDVGVPKRPQETFLVRGARHVCVDVRTELYRDRDQGVRGSGGVGEADQVADAGAAAEEGDVVGDEGVRVLRARGAVERV
jgi:hypothetical protein